MTYFDRKWRPIWGEELRAFVRGKTIADTASDEYESVTFFTDGSALKCTPVDGRVYSEHTADSATVEYEVADPPANGAK